MRVEVTSAGFTSGWEFPGSDAFEEWASRRLWLRGGGFCVLRTRNSIVGDILFPAICKSVRGANGDERRLDVHRIECDGAANLPTRALLSSLEITADLSPFEAREPLRLRLTDRAMVLVFTEREPVPPREWERFLQLIDHYAKGSPALELCLIFLDFRGGIAGEPSFDFISGRCTHLVLSGAAEFEESALWKPYLHQRACWEAGGDPHFAAELGDLIATSQPGDDSQVEQLLSEFALEMSSKFKVDELANDVAIATNRQSIARDAARQRLNDRGVLWQPPGLKRLELVPWASRALLSCGNALPDGVILSLRHNLVCTPLATEVLTQCLNAEARIRMQLAGQERSFPKEESERAYQRYRDGEDQFVIYPSAHPSPPSRVQDVWSFASLGETLRACEAVPQRFWDTVRLRNAVAHGHYVCWAHVKMAWQQLRRFDA